ncbi:DUF5518 domain-containing protein [Halopelagius longus]|uniref:DUF5518 domain-containing protein n=1 Tax=Halopelagius longus TaxID=1236180 RepID=A0A1H1G1R2_9EURY|nr:DUF5518 domain-containing protein [Halopelagius longus]RDI69895.1 hypothetical protein DWB78_17250 [Halopelagius longus]SDR07162.1 hypothetical protein SAMN05216278_3465 [Halopelagius longus]
MPKIGPVAFEVSDTWKYALLGGLASIPFTTLGYLETGSELSLSPVLFGGLLAGYLAQRNTGTSSGVGFRAGLVGGLPVLLVLADVLAATSGLAGPTWFVAVGIALALGFVAVVAALVFGLSGLVGVIGGRIGGWLAGSGGRRHPPAIST